MASTTVDTLITRYVMDDASHHRGATRVVNDTQRVGRAQDSARRSTSDMNAGFAKFSNVLSMGATVAAAAAASIIALGAAILSASVSAAMKAAEFEALENSLKAVSLNAQEAKKDLLDLRSIAKAPGIDIEGAVKGLVGLKFSGMGSDQAKEIISQAGNANAIAGGGRQEFEQILRAIKQIASKPFLQGDELLQLQEAGVPATAWLKSALGTADTEKLKQAGIDSALVLDILTMEMSKLNRATGGAKNEIENMRIAVEQSEIAYGKGFLTGFLDDVDKFTKSMEELTDSGIFLSLGETIGGEIQRGLDIFTSDDLAKSMIHLGAIFVDASTAAMTLINALKPFLQYAFGPLTTVSGLLSGGAGQKWAQSELDKLDQFRKEKTQRDAERAKEEADRKARIEGARSGIEARRQEAAGAIAAGEVKDPVAQEIADNTRRSAIASEQMLKDYQSAVFGGSELGKMGVSAREIKSIRGNSRGGTTEMNRVIEALEAWQNSIMRSGIKAQQHFTHG